MSFEKEIKSAIIECEGLSFEEKTKGLWNNKEILRYFNLYGLGEPEKFFLEKLSKENKFKLKGKVLVVGGGTGNLARALAKCNVLWYVVEIDSSREMVDFSNQLSKKEKLYPRCKSFLSDARKINFSNDYFDYVFCYAVLRYIPKDDYQIFFRELKRISKKVIIADAGIEKEFMDFMRANNLCFNYKKKRMVFNRTSLFYILFRKYFSDKVFKQKIDSVSSDYLSKLVKLAGKKEGKFLYLEF